MRRRFLVIILASTLPVMATGIPQGPAWTGSKALPPALTSALQRFSTEAVKGQLRVPSRISAPPSVCSIPLVEVPRQPDERSWDTMPRVPATSPDHNQIAPPAPPCTADNRIRPKKQTPRFYGPKVLPR
jgi:hypothetical protein